MSRKPIDQQQPTECRQAVWAWIRKCGRAFTINDILYDVRLSTTSVNDYLAGLTKAGYLDASPGATQMVATLYTLVNDIGNDAPRVRKDGSAVTQGQGQQQMWNTMRVIKQFNTTDLAFNSSIPECQITDREAKGYIGHLLKAGYLRQLTPGKPGHKPGTGTQARYMLIPTMWSGPHPPQIQRTKQVYDPNLKKVVWFRIEGGAE